MPSSTRLGSRPSACRTRAYSSSDKPWSATIWGVISVMARALSGMGEVRHLPRWETSKSLCHPGLVPGSTLRRGDWHEPLASPLLPGGPRNKSGVT
ncbi:hypothetical protein WR25_19836 [Diploscapter pachys]|uniref:Uncharacterized protein n=1 Tax=Diploscapter pachys TaxID=2018661 RepID=A0A2A2JXS0_9BILA|nr:hypothetical protein WR25_19836 [Diploscapter pachys]